jgi:arylsulfatase A-like enzyme
MPLVMVGPGIKRGVTFDYTEAIDTVPTLCHLMGVNPPLNADGRILAEALVNPPAGVAPRQQKIKETGGQGRFSALRQAQQDYFDIERILEWHQFGTYDRFSAHHKQLLARLNAMLPT